MNEDAFNISMRKFLKTVGVTAQREMEKAVREAISSGRLAGTETLPAKAVVSLGRIDFTFTIDGRIDLE